MTATAAQDHCLPARSRRDDEHPELGGPLAAFLHGLRLPLPAQLTHLATLGVLALIYEITDTTPLPAALLNVVAQQAAAWAIVYPVMLAVHRLFPRSLLPVMVIALLLTTVVRTAAGHLMLEAVTGQPDLLVPRLVFWLVINATWNLASVYLLVHVHTRQQLLVRADEGRGALDRARASLRRQHRLGRPVLMATLQGVIRPGLEAARHRLPRIDDVTQLRQLAEELRRVDTALRSSLDVDEPDGVRLPTAPALGRVLGMRVQRPLREFLLGQVLAAVVVLALLWRLVDERVLHMITTAFVSTTGLFLIAAIVERMQLDARGSRRRGAGTPTTDVVVRLAVMLLLQAVILVTVLSTRSGPRLVDTAGAIWIAVGIAALTALPSLLPRGEARTLARSSPLRLVLACAVHGLSQGAIVMLGVRPQDMAGAVLSGAVLAVISVPCGLLASDVTTIASRNRRLHIAADGLSRARAAVEAQQAEEQRVLSGLVHNPLQGRISSVAMSLSFSADGILDPVAVRGRTLQQLDDTLAWIEEVLEAEPAPA